MCSLITISVGVIGLKRFGSDLQEDVLLNLSQIPSRNISILIRLMFTVFVASQIPYSFMPFKLAFFALVDETFNKTISEKLSQRQINY